MLLSTAARRRPGRRHLLGYFLTFFALVGCLFLAACVQNNSGSGGNSGTPAGMYTATVSGNAATFSTVTTTLNLTVQ
jgi:hypothetical protein